MIDAICASLPFPRPRHGRLMERCSGLLESSPRASDPIDTRYWRELVRYARSLAASRDLRAELPGGSCRRPWRPSTAWTALIRSRWGQPPRVLLCRASERRVALPVRDDSDPFDRVVWGSGASISPPPRPVILTRSRPDALRMAQRSLLLGRCERCGTGTGMTPLLATFESHGDRFDFHRTGDEIEITYGCWKYDEVILMPDYYDEYEPWPNRERSTPAGASTDPTLGRQSLLGCRMARPADWTSRTTASWCAQAR